MFKKSNIRSVVSSDLAKLKTVLDDTGLFPSEFLEGMLNPFFNGPHCTDYWKTYEHDGQPVALLFCEQERMTESTWNVLAVAVSPALQGVCQPFFPGPVGPGGRWRKPINILN